MLSLSFMKICSGIFNSRITIVVFDGSERMLKGATLLKSHATFVVLVATLQEKVGGASRSSNICLDEDRFITTFKQQTHISVSLSLRCIQINAALPDS